MLNPIPVNESGNQVNNQASSGGSEGVEGGDPAVDVDCIGVANCNPVNGKYRFQILRGIITNSHVKSIRAATRRIIKFRVGLGMGVVMLSLVVLELGIVIL